MKTGVCSVSFRSLSIEELVDLTVKAGLDAIEWGGDIHVPHGDLATAKRARSVTEFAGLEVSSYGSYYSPLDVDGNKVEFEAVLDTAFALGVKTIRIWAGKRSTTDSTPEYRKALIEQTLLFANQAKARGVRLAFEFHMNTLTDSNESVVGLLSDLVHPNIYVYWQPPYWISDVSYRVQGLESLRSRLLNFHVFHWGFDDSKAESWDRAITRYSLARGSDEWGRYLRIGRVQAEYALLEFIKDDDSEQFLRDAAELKRLVL